MSASDYIKHKRVGTQIKDVLQNSKKLAPPVFNDQMYIDFKQYTVENNIPDTKLIENSLLPTGSSLIFDMLKITSSCPTFPICSNTEARTNRIPLANVYSNAKQPAKYLKLTKRPYGQISHLNKPDCTCIVNGKFSNSLYINPVNKALKYANAK